MRCGVTESINAHLAGNIDALVKIAACIPVVIGSVLYTSFADYSWLYAQYALKKIGPNA